MQTYEQTIIIKVGAENDDEAKRVTNVITTRLGDGENVIGDWFSIVRGNGLLYMSAREPRGPINHGEGVISDDGDR